MYATKKILKFITVLEIQSKEAKTAEGPNRLAIMSKGRDLTANEREIVHSKIKQFWNYEKMQIQYGKMSSITTCSTDQVVYSI